MKPLSDQTSRSQSFVHAQKTAHDQYGPATDHRPFGDFKHNTFRDLSDLYAIVSFLVHKAIPSQSQTMCDRGLIKAKSTNSLTTKSH